jgi:hypothetical protein
MKVEISTVDIIELEISNQTDLILSLLSTKSGIDKEQILAAKITENQELVLNKIANEISQINITECLQELFTFMAKMKTLSNNRQVILTIK